MSGRGYPEVFVRLAHLVPADCREQYWRFLAYCQALPPNDDITLLLEATGYHILIVQTIPKELAVEREAIQRVMRTTLRTLEDANSDLAKQLSGFLTALEISFQNNQAKQEEFLEAMSKSTRDLASTRQRHDREMHELWIKIRPWAIAHLFAPVIMLGVGVALGYWLCTVFQHSG